MLSTGPPFQTFSRPTSIRLSKQAAEVLSTSQRSFKLFGHDVVNIYQLSEKRMAFLQTCSLQQLAPRTSFARISRSRFDDLPHGSVILRLPFLALYFTWKTR